MATDAMDEGRSEIAIKRLDKLMETVVQNLGKSKLLPENPEDDGE